MIEAWESGDTTPDWKLFEAGKTHNNNQTPNHYDMVDANYEFYRGNQWRNAKQTTLPRPVFNVIKRVASFFVSSLCATPAKINYEPAMTADNAQDEDANQGAKMATKQASILFDKWDMQGIIRDSYFDGAISGDWCWHFLWDTTAKPFGGKYKDIEGEIKIELVDGSNVMMGNANLNSCRNIDNQPYIIIVGRDTVKNLQAERKLLNKKAADDEIQGDSNYQWQAADAGKLEVDTDESKKALYIIVYRKNEDGIVTMSKCTQHSYIFKDVVTDLEHYPIVMDGWEHQKNQYHNRALVTGMLPNQIFINQMMALVMQHLYMTGFPKAIYNSDLISEWNNSVGEAIGVSGSLDMNIRNAATYLQPGQMSAQIIQVLEMAMQWTKEMLGISDASMGNVRPDNTSAIIAVQKSTNIPLENPRANMFASIDRAGQIIMDMMGTYYGTRPIVIETETGTALEQYDFGKMKNLWLRCRVDVGETSHWSELAIVQTMDNLFAQGIIDAIQYIKRVPAQYIPQRDELIEELMQKIPQRTTPPKPPPVPTQPIQAPEQGNQEAQYEQMAAFFDTLPPQVQAKLQTLPPEQMEQAVLSLMTTAPQN